ncbi:GTPase HflX [Hydrogenophaga sp. PAMC20947]|uniref:GTPase HflX n=1 Tax=Hydrogenophaga sp. PAMC20947 TaxID=2565558 RepID=UPI00109DBFAC|nr:GTPase HflX [Hydrogenophaga sp. PAMC20947]QCB45259.1 GTPase HflX [Hydrogenophaga sp. PAMC20947]
MNAPTSSKPSLPSVILVGVDFGHAHFDGELEELGLLAKTAGFAVADRVSCKRRAPDPALFVGSGKAQEIKMLAQSTGASEVLFDQSLSPAQQRNLERELGMPVNDRTLLILQIFAQRARSHEGKLQVELARLQYLSTRLVRRWSHLERQSGGIGMRGGPGETQIELDRRMIGDSIKRTKERLEKVKKQRATQRRQRERRDAFMISLVGYTNAGKSSLFNALVKARAYAADQLFATLDTTTRQLYLGEAGRSVSLSDTVGFIRDLPHGLVDAFAATLQEAADADLLLHVVDAANPAHLEQIQAVMGVLREIGAGDVPQVLVFNKLDAMDANHLPRTLDDQMELDGVSVPRVFVSALAGTGLPELRALLAQRVMACAPADALQAEGPINEFEDPVS